MMLGILSRNGFPWKVLIQQKRSSMWKITSVRLPLTNTSVHKLSTKGPKVQKLMFQSSWLDQYNWLVYSASDAGGYCKFCVMFPPKNSRLSNAVLVNRHLQNLQKAKGKEGVLDRHGQQDYHKSSVTECKLLCQAFRQPENHVDTLLIQKRKKTYEDNVHILKSIILAVILCGKQNIPLRGHRT